MKILSFIGAMFGAVVGVVIAVFVAAVISMLLLLNGPAMIWLAMALGGAFAVLGSRLMTKLMESAR